MTEMVTIYKPASVGRTTMLLRTLGPVLDDERYVVCDAATRRLMRRGVAELSSQVLAEEMSDVRALRDAGRPPQELVVAEALAKERRRRMDAAQSMDRVVAKHPLPWRVNPEFNGWDILGEADGPTPDPILDANGMPVMSPSQWLLAEPGVMELIVEAVNRG